jgi:hypothetical protein
MSKFEAGKSGNPSGRPKGLPDSRTKLRNLLMPQAEALVNKAIELALAGDVIALRLCLERLVPKMKSDYVSFSLSINDISNIKNLLSSNAEIIKAVSIGAITPEQGQAFSSLLEIQHKFIVNSEIEKRLEAIEQTLSDRQKYEREQTK